jgi:hypothetical protein
MPVPQSIFRGPQWFSILMVAIASVSLHDVASTQQPPLEGCYRADRVLSSAATGVPRMITGDSAVSEHAYSRFELRSEGRVDRPGTYERNAWSRASHWQLDEGTLHVRLSTGHSGWDLRVVPDTTGDGSYVGEAEYLTDVVVVDGAWEAPRVKVRLTREHCPDQ